MALTHFAHYFPSEARQTGLAPFKTYVLGGANTRFACWDSFPSAVKESAQFDFSHWIIVGVSKTTQTAYARLSLFSVADFSMHLGSVDVSADKEVIVEIDPTAPHPPNDMRYEQRDFSHERPSYPTDPEETHRARVTAQCLDALGQLLAKIERKELDQLLDELHPVLAASAALDQSERLACIQKIVTNQAQRILMLLKYAAAGLAKQFEASYLADVVRDEIDSFIQSDATTPSGLSGKTERLLALALDRFAKDLLDRVESGGLDRASLESLLNGGLGAAVVGPVLMPCLQEAVVGHMSRLHGRGSS
ncbi:hypothetical protein M0765_019650 [Variovorax sp. S2]|uniref:hypothetical protein n=1 Tax=Variovorax sp. S12S4 TaxID=3029170 RepID=UPI00215BA175|nr:hypothetical protein [Variovorax sp. S12S4]MCR8959869.1 hypothetical protein [Variovorax sp. S12S4]